MNLYNKLKLVKKIHHLSKDPSKTKRVFAVVDHVIESSPKEKLDRAQKILNESQEFNDMRAALKTKNLKELYSIDNLLAHKPGTLGHELGKVYKQGNMNAEFFSYRDETNPLWTMRNRLAQTHDIFHLLAGYGTSPLDEYALQAFYLGQEPSVTAYGIMMAGFFGVLSKPSAYRVQELMDSITSAYTQGKNARSMIYVVWEDKFDKDIEEIRKEFRL